jgi:hypothetical protein
MEMHRLLGIVVFHLQQQGVRRARVGVRIEAAQGLGEFGGNWHDLEIDCHCFHIKSIASF